MTLDQLIVRLKTRVKVDLESEVDLTNTDLATTEVIRAARQITREIFCLYVDRSVLTLAANDQKIDLLSSKCADRIYLCDGLFINGAWLTKLEQSVFYDDLPDYVTATSTASPSYWTPIRDSVVMLDRPVNATGAAATNYARGFREHATYTYTAHNATEMEGSEIFHWLYLDQAALNISKSYVSGVEALTRRNLIKNELKERIEQYKEENLNEYKQIRRKATAGMTRRITTLSNAR